MSKVYTQEEYDIAVEAAYYKGKYEEHSIFEVLQLSQEKRNSADKALREAELELKIMGIDRITELASQRDELKDKYIKLMEHLNGFNKATTKRI